ncbi:MAG: cysteine--tRNA ligase [Peptoniphilaceae bacterium]|nr:cysteine--tRNA ligase [Peptoniphilaceae bacterium]
MKIHNTLTGKKEEFIPQQKNEIKMYVCGPTVYDYIHIGNARPLVVFDTFRRYMTYRGYNVKFVQNFTDVDDKIINKAIDQNITYKEVSEKFIKAYEEDAKDLNIDEEHTIHPKATELMDEMIDFIDELIKKEDAYVVDGNVYFDVSKADKYGKLSKKNLDDLIIGASGRVDEDGEKKSPADFALWKKVKKEKEPSWHTPRGYGRPGWHIECSTMSRNILGDTLDIHAGGEDLKFPHHENEIAQSEALTGKPLANYWMHNGMIQVNGEKMSKSLGNFFTLKDIKKEYDLIIIRFWLLNANYRLPINFSREIIEQSKSSLERLNNSVFRLEDILKKLKENENGLSDDEKEKLEKLNSFEKKFIEVMDDDLNTADAITVLFEISKFANTEVTLQSSYEFAKIVYNKFIELENVLGILNKKKELSKEENLIIEKLVAERIEAKKNKNYEKADEIRKKLSEMGVVLKDNRDGTSSREKK